MVCVELIEGLWSDLNVPTDVPHTYKDAWLSVAFAVLNVMLKSWTHRLSLLPLLRLLLFITISRAKCRKVRGFSLFRSTPPFLSLARAIASLCPRAKEPMDQRTSLLSSVAPRW
jgi:hypothetical protein